MSLIRAYSIETRRLVRLGVVATPPRPPRRTFQRVLIGTSSSRSSSSGACRDSASVTGMPSSASCSIRGTSPTVETVMPRADMPSPSGRLVGEPAYGADDRLVVGHRLAHAHEDDVGDPARPAGDLAAGERPRAGDDLLDDLGGRHVALQPALAGGAERAGHAAAGLRGDAHRDPVGVAHQHRLDQRAVEEPPQRLAGRARCRPRMRAQRRHQLAAAARRRAGPGRRPAGRSSRRGRRRAGRSSGWRAAWRGTPGRPEPGHQLLALGGGRGRRGGAAACAGRAARRRRAGGSWCSGGAGGQTSSQCPTDRRGSEPCAGRGRRRGSAAAARSARPWPAASRAGP